MSDSFADLWNSTTPAKPAEPPRTLGSLTPNVSGQPRKPQNDVFSMLAAAGSHTSSRSTTPLYTGVQQTQKPAPGGGQPSATTPATTSGGDAFSDLLSGVSSTKSNTTNMTIAERAALAEKQRLERLRTDKQSADASASTWAGLDALATATPIAPRVSSKSSAVSKPVEDDWDLSFDGPPKPTPTRPVITKVAPTDDDWGLDGLISQPAPSKPAPAQSRAQSSQLLWDDLDDFTSQPLRVQSSSRASPAPGKGRSSTPGSFDFGDREDGLLDDRSDNEDDILGVLGKPIQAKPPSDIVAHATPSPQPVASGQRSRAVSPPPHIVGQIVEMGFTPQQARIALASTDTGLDVQAALETLLANGAGSSTPPQSEESRRRERPRERERERFRDAGDDDKAPPRIHPRRDRQREPPSRENSSSAGEAQRGLGEHADELLAQASKIGLSMFNRANALWSVGREKVQKAYEEHSSAVGGRAPVARKDGKPRWMQDAVEREENGWGEHVTSDGFRDGHDDAEPLPPHPDEQPAAPARSRAPERVSRAASRSAEEPSSRVKTGNLLADDTPTVYVSPFRRKVPPRTQGSTSTQQTPAPALPPAKAPSPPPLVQRKTVAASASAIATSAKHKGAGTEMFKLGRYAEAETSYSQAIAALPDNHLLLVPLYNNRALTRIKTGDHAGAVEDATTVLTIIGSSYHPAREAKVTKEDEGAGVDLADAYVKALRRRAEAYEGREKWDTARQDWETLSGTEWAGKARNEAAQAAGRCRRMVAMEKGGAASNGAPAAAAPKVKPRPKSKPVSRLPTPPSEALNRVREATQAAEAEDNEKHALKDNVDSRLVAWKGGKETNIRALIASLDTVLWPELGWQKVGMHELVTPAQVKIRYTKAIAKLHPDKLNVNNTTLEQRMIANGVFGSLNDAWNVFKQ